MWLLIGRYRGSRFGFDICLLTCSSCSHLRTLGQEQNLVVSSRRKPKDVYGQVVETVCGKKIESWRLR